MGLLEKAEKIQTDTPEPAPAKVEPVLEPTPVSKSDSAPQKKKSRRSRKKAKTKKTKKERVPKVMPDGFERAGKARSAARYLFDFIVNFGLMAFLIGLFIMFYTDITWPLIASMLLAVGNVFYLPSKFSRSAGNIVSGTQFINTRGDSPSFLYHIGKSLNVPLIFFGLVAIMMAISSGTEWTTGMKVFVGVSLTLMLIPIIDRIMYRMRDGDLGFWDTLFGGVWLVAASKEASDSGIIQRLQSIGEYAEQRGMLSEDDSK